MFGRFNSGTLWYTNIIWKDPPFSTGRYTTNQVYVFVFLPEFSHLTVAMPAKSRETHVSRETIFYRGDGRRGMNMYP